MTIEPPPDFDVMRKILAPPADEAAAPRCLTASNPPLSYNKSDDDARHE
jgi:hypothetical protein